MTAEPIAPEVLHVWAISLRASEEARREVIAELAPNTSCSPCWRNPRSTSSWV